jgi:hypothetical protein
MKLLLAFIMLSANVVYAQSTTSTTSLKNKRKSFRKKVRINYWSSLDKTAVSENTISGNNSSYYQQFDFQYHFSDKVRLSFVPRFSINDSEPTDSGRNDRVSEYDPRVTLVTRIFNTDNIGVSLFTGVELPMSKSSQDAEKIGKLRGAVLANFKIDDKNSLLTWIGYNRNLYSSATGSVDETSRFDITEWFSYTNTSLSERYALRLDFSGGLDHIAGSNDLAIRREQSSSVFQAGINTVLGSWDIFGYVAHYPAKTKAIDTLGAGIQFFKSFRF